MRSRLVIQAVLILPLILSGCAGRHEIVLRRDNAGFTQEGKYLMFNEETFTGRLEGYFESGQLKSKSAYTHGLAEGLSQTWFADGKIESLRNYHQGEKVGLHQGWWNNGNQRFEYHFVNGQYDGPFKEWYENGKPLHAFVYDQDREVSAVGWRENGKTYINFVVRNGKKYGLTNSRLCYSLKDEQGVYQTSKP